MDLIRDPAKHRLRPASVAMLAAWQGVEPGQEYPPGCFCNSPPFHTRRLSRLSSSPVTLLESLRTHNPDGIHVHSTPHSLHPAEIAQKSAMFASILVAALGALPLFSQGEHIPPLDLDARWLPRVFPVAMPPPCRANPIWNLSRCCRSPR